MDIKKYLTKELAKKIGAVVYNELIHPIAKELVEDSATPFDDAFLGLLDSFVKDNLLKVED